MKIIYKNGEYYKQTLTKIDNRPLELEDSNFRVDSTGWEEKNSDNTTYKINTEGDIREYLEGKYKGEQLFTWEAAMRETKKVGKRLPTDKEFTEIIGDTNCHDFIKKYKTPLSGYQDADGTTFFNRGNYTYLWSSSLTGGLAHGRNLLRRNSTVSRNRWHKAYSFSVRCIKD